ncbi:Endoplasmic reticulum-Golgi intermediate compartment protein 2 [Nymphon striatum]|nr:Endoplasmic reticulum-Golgi intermediate compartment protein 2 [Nymphon striatum]
MLRRRRSTLKSVKELDAFPKVPESYKKNTATGGTISIFCFILILILVISEINFFLKSNFKFNYGVDTDLDSKLKINVDMTIAMPCNAIGADVLDVTNQNAQTYGSLEEHDVFFELTDEQRESWNYQRRVNQHIRREYHSLQELIWRSGAPKVVYDMDQNADRNKVPDACRLTGSLTVNKLAGNFHITAGKLLPSFGIHAHLSMFLRDSDYNFSHRIENLSFGDQVDGIFNSLDGDEKISKDHFQIYTYYIKVVPTEVDTYSYKVKTFQYSVTEQSRVVNHNQGSHGIPGIFIKYDMSSIKVKIVESRQPLWQFLVRLCAIVGGVFATSGIFSGIVGFVADLFLNKTPAKIAQSISDDDDAFVSATESFKSSSPNGIKSSSDRSSITSLPSVEELDDSVISLS